MMWVKRWFVMMALGGMLLAGPISCVVAPVEPGYVSSPPVVVIRPYRHYRSYRYYEPYRPYHPHWRYHSRPYRDYRTYRPYYGWRPQGHRW